MTGDNAEVMFSLFPPDPSQQEPDHTHTHTVTPAPLVTTCPAKSHINRTDHIASPHTLLHLPPSDLTQSQSANSQIVHTRHTHTHLLLWLLRHLFLLSVLLLTLTLQLSKLSKLPVNQRLYYSLHPHYLSSQRMWSNTHQSTTLALRKRTPDSLPPSPAFDEVGRGVNDYHHSIERLLLQTEPLPGELHSA